MYEVLEDILAEIHPVRVRFGIADGGIDIGSVEEGVRSRDGPAFHRAAAALDEADDRDLHVAVTTDSPVDGLLAGSLNLLLIARERRTDRQFEVIEAYERYGTQQAAATELGVPQQAVSQALNRADYRRRRRGRRGYRRGYRVVDREA